MWPLHKRISLPLEVKLESIIKKLICFTLRPQMREIIGVPKTSIFTEEI